MAAKYYLKEECTLCQAFDDNAPHRKDIGCKGKGFIRGARCYGVDGSNTKEV
mgnify:CR=1 FL=1